MPCRNDLWMKSFILGFMLYAPILLAQPIDIRIDRGLAVEDYDFSWVYWFETHGQRYVREAVGDRALPWDTPASRRWRGQVITALEPILDDEEDGVRAAAVLALARIDHEPLLDRVLPSSAGGASLLLDASEEVRLSAWVSLGLLQTAEARAALAVDPIQGIDEVDRVGQAVAIGLLSKIDRVHAKWLIARMGDAGESLEVKRWCVWAMTRHDDASVDAAFGDVLAKLPSTFLIGEVLGNSSYIQRRGGPLWLVDVLRYHPDVRRWQGYRALSQLPADGVNGSTPRRLAMETRVAASLAIAEQPILVDEDDQRFLLAQLRRRMVRGNSDQAMDFNRGFDTIAYAMHCAGTEMDRALLYDQLRGYTTLRVDDPAVVEKFGEDGVPTQDDLFVRQSDNELRGYAALATGLLIRRATEGTELHQKRPVILDRAIEIERLKRRFGLRLMRAVANDAEPVSYRAACAIALGLTGDDRYKAELSIELGKLRAGDEAVLGYGLLALAMLGEDRVPDPAMRYLTRPGQVVSVGDLLGRRASLRALSVFGPAGDKRNVQLWGRDPWVSLDVAEMTAWTGEYDAVPLMINALSSESPLWRKTAARSLGNVFEASWPSRLSALIDGTNPTLSLRPLKLADARDTAVDEPPNAGTLLWPMGRVYSLSDPMLIGMKQGVFDLKTQVDQDAR